MIQKEMQELLAMRTIEPFSCGAASFSIVFVVPKCMAGLQHILNHK